MEERLAENLNISLENSLKRKKQHIDVLTEEKETELETELLPKEDKEHVFDLNMCFVSVGLVADAGGNLAQMSNQIKMKEEGSMEKFNPWNKDIMLLGKYAGIDE